MRGSKRAWWAPRRAPLLDDDHASLPGWPAIGAEDSGAVQSDVTVDLPGIHASPTILHPVSGAGAAPIVDLGANELTSLLYPCDRDGGQLAAGSRRP